ncbi:MAG: apolipoprotein N-acyltransferase, partial [Thermodesulfobacteriota bacterium]
MKAIVRSLLSALMLVLSFPTWDMGYLAWVALIPVFLSIRNRNSPTISLLFSLCGILFFLGIFNWILIIKGYRIYHHILLAIYFASYFGLFGAALAFISKRMGETAALCASPFLWVLQEWLRSHFFFLGLPWGLLGHTQHRIPVVIQIASITGTYGISFLIVLVNAAFAAVMRRSLVRLSDLKCHRTTIKVTKSELALLISAAVCVGLVMAYGYHGISGKIEGKPINIALIQGNIEQEKKWDPKYADEIMSVYSELTITAAQSRPLLIVWPETAVPGSISLNPDIYEKLIEIVKKTDTPLILGSAQHQKFTISDQADKTFLNSAFLLTPQEDGVVSQQYDKIRLFPFGEYLPHKHIIPWKLLNVSSFNEYVPGEDYTLFRISPHQFSVTICWENIFSDLVRGFVKNGAQFILNITNEARFGKTAA